MPTKAPGSHGPSQFWRWLAAVALVTVLFLINEVAGTGGYLERREQQRRMDSLSREIEQLKTENEQLAEHVRNLRGNPAAIEQYAREQLHLARPGELVVALPPLGQGSAPSSSPASQ